MLDSKPDRETARGKNKSGRVQLMRRAGKGSPLLYVPFDEPLLVFENSCRHG